MAVLPEHKTPASVTEYVLSILSASERTPYIGEPISQLQHALQTAALAAPGPGAGCGCEVRNLGGRALASSVGRVGHETLGAAMLLALGFPEKVARLVGSHVASKRYLCAVDASYRDRLSEASRRSLPLQGGPMDGGGEGGVCGGASGAGRCVS